MCVSLCTASLGKPPFILPKPGLGRGVCSALSFPSAWERPNQAGVTFPAPARAGERPGGSALEVEPYYSFPVYLQRPWRDRHLGALSWGEPSPPNPSGCVTQEGLAHSDSGGVARPFCRRRGEGRWAELRSVLSPPPQAHLWPWGFLSGGGRLGPLVPWVISIPRCPFWALDPVAPPEAGSPGPLPPEPARLECSLLLAGPLPVRHVGSRFLSPTPAH